MALLIEMIGISYWNLKVKDSRWLILKIYFHNLFYTYRYKRIAQLKTKLHHIKQTLTVNAGTKFLCWYLNDYLLLSAFFWIPKKS